MYNIYSLSICLLFISTNFVSCTQPGEVVGEWATSFGNELWDLAKTITKSTDIQNSYKINNVQVEKKDPQKLLASIIEKLNIMMNQKMKAVRAIATAAEEAAEEYVFNNTFANFSYFSSKYSTIFNNDDDIIWRSIPESMQDTAFIYRNMSLNIDKHFYNLEVNTEHSAAHVPTNIYDLGEAAQSAIEWSEVLDEIFVQNYRLDPALTWQYFGSSSGVMRHYPAMEWKQEIDLFDCRTRSWFIEAATCSKDVIILIDNSGSMTGMWNHIARFTVTKILETFSNNDYVNIYKFSKKMEPLEPCFNNTLVQATLENIEALKERMKEMKPEGNADVDNALIRSFEILKDYRDVRGCDEERMGCNQAIMLVTDGVATNSSQVFEAYNSLNNGTNVPVRIFTYLIGREGKNDEIVHMACTNRGYFSQIRSLDEAAERVLKYITVIARPLVLQGVDHPVSWTHAYIRDNSFEEKLNNFENFRLLTSVAVPAYDHKVNQNNMSLQAELLGVAGTDVPIEDLEKLTTPYKIGVNGYAFIISNNGYLLLHPDLRPLYEGKLNLNYNSMDFSELEFMNNHFEPRDRDERILELREAMINHTRGQRLGLQLKKFYDGMRRPYIENFDFFFGPIANTPFTMGIALPDTEGDTWISVGDEIKKNQHMGVDFKEYFEGSNWKIHPKWIYCKYQVTENQDFSTLESEFLHFLEKMSHEDWKWYNQYQHKENGEGSEESIDFDKDDWAFLNLENREHYCDKELIQRLIFDAKVMHEAFKPWKFKNESDKRLFDLFNANLRFVATMSGLTKWEYVFGDNSNNTKKFEDTNIRGIDEIWYKSAVLQHKIDPHSFVYSVPFEGNNKTKVLVTGSYAIFPRDAGIEAPGSVVGFQFNHTSMYRRFMDITSKTNCNGCMETCKSELLDCYIIDNNGYIIISEKFDDTGKFFGEIEGAVMDWMISNNTFENITVYDFQAICVRQHQATNIANILMQPFISIGNLIKWFIYQTMLFFIQTSFYEWNEFWVSAMPFQDYDILTTEAPTAKPTPKLRKGQTREEEEYFRELRERPPEIIYEDDPCDKKATLYMLNQTKFILEGGFSGEIRSDCSRPFFVKRIPHSNLLLIAVQTTTQTCYKKFSVEPEEILYPVDSQPPCNKLPLNDLPRRKLSGCYNEHPLEYKIKMCGAATLPRNNLYLSFFIPIIVAILSMIKNR